MGKIWNRWNRLAWTGLCLMLSALTVSAQPYLDNETLNSNQDPNNETRRSDHFRLSFGQYNRDTGTPMTEQLAQGNLQMFERMWNRWISEMGLHDINESATAPDGKKYKTNFEFLMTRNDGGGGGAYSSMDSNGFFWAMANTSSCRFDPPSGATPHEMGHVWEGSAAGFNGTNSSGMWWECTANWMQLQFLNTYPQAGGLIWNSMYYPAHGRDYYDAFAIWEAARDDPRYGANWVNRVWSDATPTQQVNEYIVDRMVRVDTSGTPDNANASRDLWGDMAKKCVNWDFERQQWLAQANNDETSGDPGTAWYWYQRCRTPLVKVPGTAGWYRPERSHLPMEYGFNIIPLTAAPGTTVDCNFQPLCDPVRQSDWRACLVAISNNNNARYSRLWNTGTNSIQLAADEAKLYLVVIATPKPMKISDPMMNAYRTDAGLQFPYAVSFANAAPKNVTFPNPGGLLTHANGGGKKASTANVDATAWIGPNAMVLNTAQVRGNARIEDYAVVRNSAQVRDNAVVSGHALVQDTAQVSGNATVRDWGRVFGNAQVSENAKVIEHGNCGDTGTTVRGNAVIKGTTYAYAPSSVLGCAIWDGDTANGGTNVDHGAGFGWSWGFDANYWNGLADNAYIYAQHSFEKENAVFAMDEYGINSGFLMNGARVAKDTTAPTRGGRVLPLDGVSQYVELHNSVNDWKDLTVAVWVKRTGTAADQRIWSMGDGAAKVMFLTPQDSATGNLRFSISNGTTTQNLDGAAPLPANAWNHVAVVFSAGSATLYLNGVAAAAGAAAVFPDQLNAPLRENANYLGRGNAGNYLAGYLDDFRVYSKGLTAAEVLAVYNTAAPAAVTVTADTAAPTPNAATWLIAPVAVGDSAVQMNATPGTDASGWVEYYFTCTAGGGHDSGWVSFNRYTDLGLAPGTLYAYTVKMRDKNGNTTAASAPASATTLVSSAPAAAFADGPAGIASGQVRMTAVKQTSPSGLVEYKFDRTAPSAASSGWQASPTWTDTGLAAGAACTYTITARDGRGNSGAPSAPAATVASDKTAPKLPIPVAHWDMLPYATIDNKVSMTANAPADGATGVQYQFICTIGAPSTSTWQSGRTYATAAMPDGAYTFRYRVRDAALNVSPLSTPYVAVITPTSGYHNYSMPQLANLPDDTLVSFNGMVTAVNPYSYTVKDPVTGVTYTVEDSGSRDGKAQTTLASNLSKSVNAKGHLYTRAGVRIVTFATVTPSGAPITFNITGKVTNLAGAAIAGATVYASSQSDAAAHAGFTATANATGDYTIAVPDGVWYVAAGAAAYNTSADQVVSVAGANMPNNNFTLVGNVTMSGTVTQLVGGATVGGATVYFSRTPGASDNPVYTAVTDASGNYTRSVQDGTWYVSASKTGFYMARDQAVGVNGANVAGINFTLTANTRNIPATAHLLFSVVTDSLGAAGTSGNWPTYLPAGQNLAKIASPTVETYGGNKWIRNVYSEGDGFDQGTYAAPIPCNGASIVVAIRPARSSDSGNWRSIVDIFYDRLVLGIQNNTGRVLVRRNGSTATAASGTAIPDGQVTILTLVVQPDGKYKVWSNGTEILNVTGTSAMTSLVPNIPGPYANHINLGRNNPDAWTTYNGLLGDTFLYDYALPDAERLQLQADLGAKFLGTSSAFPVTATAGVGGAITPSGTTMVTAGGNQSFTITPAANYAISDVKVDGVSVGAVAAHTLTNVTASHSIAATFRATAHSITASAGAGGTISPSGALGVADGASKVFTIAPLPGYAIADVRVDGVSVGAVAIYTFANVTADHTIAATFSAVTHTVTASAGANGTIAPSGVVTMGYTDRQVFSIVPAPGYAVAAVLIDGVSAGAITSCTFENVTANHTVAASFAAVPAPRTITATAGPNGTISPNGASSVAYGANRSIIITPAAGYAVQDVLIDGVSAGTIGNYTFVNVTADHAISATFKSVLPVTGTTWVIAASAGAGGSISPPGSVTVNEGANQTFLIAPATGYAIQDVKVDGVSVGAIATYTFNNVTAAHTIAATFSAVPTFTITASAAAGGTITPNGAVIVNQNASQAFAIAPAAGYAIQGVLVDGAGVGPVPGYTFNNVTANHTIAAAFSLTTFTITASAGTGGTITPSGSVVANYGANRTFDITPQAGYVIDDVVVDGASVGKVASYVFSSIQAGHTIAATFRASTTPTFTITASAGTGGTISPVGPVQVDQDTSQTFAIVAAAGFAIGNVTVDGVSIGAVSSYTFDNVTADHTIAVHFSGLPAARVRGWERWE